MTRQQAAEVASWRSSPLTSKTMWTIYIGQGSLAAGLWQVLSIQREHASTAVLLALVASIALVAITGVAGLAWTDPAVAVVRALKAQPESAPAPATAPKDPAP